MIQGKTLIIAVLVVAFGMSSFAWWHRWQRSQVVIEHWGKEAPLLIRTGKNAEILKLVALPSGNEDPPIGQETLTAKSEFGESTLVIEQAIDISEARGLIHARFQLIQREAFGWEVPRNKQCSPSWPVALRFSEGNQTATMLLDFDCKRALLLERQKEVDMSPITKGMKAYVDAILKSSDSADQPDALATEAASNP